MDKDPIGAAEQFQLPSSFLFFFLFASMKLSNILPFLASANSVWGASLQEVSNFGNNPTSIQMYIYIPDSVTDNAAVIVAVGHAASEKK